MGKGRSLLLVCLLGVACAAVASAPAQARTVWLCKPGLRSNPCKPSQRTTVISSSGKQKVVKLRNARRPKIDCFYVYPTVSDQKTATANRHIDPEERSIALYQAARYSRVCRVFAPMYRQFTLAALNGQKKATKADINRGYTDVRHAFLDYLRHYSKGRGVVLIGHSQGTFVLKRLIRDEVDSKRKRRRRLISALLLGGNVQVKKGSSVGGTFRHVRACRSRRQLACAVAFSTFGGPVPSDSAFGRTHAKGRQVLCTNPGALGGGSAPLTTELPTAPFAPGTTIGLATLAVGLRPQVPTPWISLRGGYRGHCSSASKARVLQITGKPRLHAVPANFGLHLVDANIALGNLVSLVRSQAARYVNR